MNFYYDQDEIKFYELRNRKGPDTVWISKVAEANDRATGVTQNWRYIRKVFDRREDNEIVRMNGEYELRCSPAGRDQIKVVVYGNDPSQSAFTLQKFHRYGYSPTQFTNFTFYRDEFQELLDFLGLVQFLDLSNKDRFQYSMAKLRDMVLVERSEGELIDVLRKLHGDERLQLLEKLKDANLTKEDLDILSGRKDGLETFRTKLFIDKDWDEPKWQDFFENNNWIFGYGLDYRFLKILQREASVSNVDLDGSNVVEGDFLLGSTEFTVLVELKRPDTPLFTTAKNRSHAWKMSSVVLDAVSQVLAQKAEWEVKSRGKNFDTSGKLIRQRTHDPKCLLIIGSKEQFNGSEREQELKYETFELFRRNLRNVELLTYSELFDRADFIVNQRSTKPPRDERLPDPGPDFDDDIPF